MKKSELATRLAKQAGVSPAEAADQLDHVVSQIISNLKKGQGAQLPGLGEFKPGAKWNFKFERQGSGRRGKR
ncbi:MAG: HU family DNA-binding protein [Acidobacteriia bacterium]|nr:HU family DNA-binding protein [Terriglobia bacterium]